MYAGHIVRCLNKSLTTKLKTVVSPLKFFERSYKPKQPSSFDLRSQVKEDIIIFQNENRKHFILVNVFAATQCAFWSYLGLFLFRSLDDPSLKFEKSKIWSKILEKERQFSTGLSVLSIFFAWSILLGTCLYSARSVRKLILHRGGSHVTFVTYNLPGYNTFKIPLNNLSSMQQRTKAKKVIPVKLKDTIFYYLIDVHGEFSNPTLFDLAVGVKRGF